MRLPPDPQPRNFFSTARRKMTSRGSATFRHCSASASPRTCRTSFPSSRARTAAGSTRRFSASMVASLTDAAAQFFSDFQASELFFLEKQVLMARIFITGSSDGLGLAAAQLLVEQGHSVVLHARSQQRADETQKKLPTAESVVVGGLQRT